MKNIYLTLLLINLNILVSLTPFDEKVHYKRTQERFSDKIVEDFFKASNFKEKQTCKEIAYQATLGLQHDKQKYTVAALSHIIEFIKHRSEEYANKRLNALDLPEEEKQEIVAKTLDVLVESFQNTLQQTGIDKAYKQTLGYSSSLETKTYQIVNMILKTQASLLNREPIMCNSCYKDKGSKLLCEHHICKDCALKQETLDGELKRLPFVCPICNKAHSRIQLRAQINGSNSFWTKMAKFQSLARE